LNAGKVADVKNLACYLLIVWLALMSAGANAYATTDPEHVAPHTHSHAFQDTHDHTPPPDVAIQAPTAQDASHADTCSQSHCGHGHPTGLLAHYGTSVKTDLLTAAPISHPSWASSAITSNIERPKWPFTTPAVVSLLS
jgi:hypothetical protein